MSEDHVYVRTTHQSWIALAVFCLFSLLNAIQWVTLSSISELSMSFFHMSSFQFNMMSMIYMIIYVLGGFFTCTTFQRVGVKKGLIIGNVLNFLGGLLKLAPGIQYPCYTTLIIPQVLSSFAQLFVLSVPPLLAAEYFEAKHRGFATAIASTSNTIGNAIALFVPPQIVKQGTRAEFQLLFILVMAACGLALILSFFVRQPVHYEYVQKKSCITSKVDEGVLSQMDANVRLSSGVSSLPHLPDDGIASDHCADLVSSHRVNGANAELYHEARSEAHSIHADVFDGNGERSSQRTVQGDLARRGGGAEPTAVLSVNEGSSAMVGVGSGPVSTELHAASSVQSARLEWQRQVIIFTDVWVAVKKLMSQRDFIFVFMSFSISMGSVWTFVSVLDQILSPFGVSDQVAGLAGGLNILIGCICSYGAGIFMDYKHLYKYLLLSCLVGTVLCCVALTVIFWRVTPFTRLMSFLLAFVYTAAGIFQSTAVPVCFEFAMEITYPFPEAVPSTLLMVGANLTSLVLLLIATAMLSNDVDPKSTSIHVMILLTSILIVGTLFSGLPRERLNRFTALQAARARMQQSDSDVGDFPVQTSEKLAKDKEASEN